MNSSVGSILLDKETVGSRYLLLHSGSDHTSNKLWRIVSKGPKVFPKEEIKKQGYPKASQENYLIIKIEPITDKEFKI